MRDIKYNKIFGIYSLLMPLIIFVLFFLVCAFGTIEGDTVSKSFGKISDFVSLFVQLVICPILFIINTVLLCLTTQKRKGFSVLSIIILIANIILCLQLMLTIINLWFLIYTILFVQPIYFIIWLIYLIYFIINYKKLQKDEESEENIETNTETVSEQQ